MPGVYLPGIARFLARGNAERVDGFLIQPDIVIAVRVLFSASGLLKPRMPIAGMVYHQVLDNADLPLVGLR
ncbi:hypothetical protein D3C87_1801810 [compost metagenome]